MKHWRDAVRACSVRRLIAPFARLDCENETERLIPIRQSWRRRRGCPCGQHLAAAAVEDLEFVAGVGGKEGGDVAESFRQCRGGEEWVFALAQVGVVEVQREGEQIDGDGVGEGGFHEAVAGALVDGALGTVGAAAIGGAAAVFVGVLAGFAADIGLGLRPDEVRETGGARPRPQRSDGRR